jgi:HPr kinase/phosphorylase
MTETLHASCIALGDRGLLILGPSGAGKSGLALQLMACGADLVADDRTEVIARDGQLIARCPATLAGLIEARDIGILSAPHRAEVALTLAIDLGQTEDQRLPPPRHITVQGIPLPLVLRPRHDHLNAAILCYLKGSRHA